MKKIFLLIAALAIVFANVVVACPPGYNGPIPGEIEVGSCKYSYTFCYGINEFGLHEIVLENIIIPCDCDPSVFEANSGYITDQILLQIAQSKELEEWDGFEIYECPDQGCLIRWRDGICYSKWQKVYDEDDNCLYWEMVKCVDKDESGNPIQVQRSCNETILICWEIVNGQRVLHIERIGFLNIPCPDGCNNNCY